jgi:hypothetical protein
MEETKKLRLLKGRIRSENQRRKGKLRSFYID